MHDLVVRGGLVVSSTGVRRADIAVRDGRITDVGMVTGPARRVIDATGRYVLPGGIEPHMHVENDFFGLPTAHDFYTQSIAAVHGGVTTFFDFANTAAGGSLPEAIAARREQMAKSAIDFAVHGRVQEAAHLSGLAEAVAAGCPSFKLYLTYPEVGLMADDRTVLAAFCAAREAGALPLVHAESEPIAAALTEEARRAKRAGLRLHVETCPQYLVLTRRLYDDPDRGMLAVCAPPLRARREAPALWRGLADGAIDCVGSDDCAYTAAAKTALLDRNPDGGPVPDFTRVVQGVPGIETRLPLLLSEGVARGRLSLERVAALTSEGPSRCLGCYPQKGAVRPGSDADLVLVDMTAERTLSPGVLHRRLDYCLYEGLRVRGWPVVTIANGEVVIEDGDFTGERGTGRFVAREPAR